MKLRVRILLAGTTALLLSACVPSNYLGLPTRGPVTAEEQQLLLAAHRLWPMTKGDCADNETGRQFNCAFLPVSTLALSSALNDKHAQLELGKRFEMGRGVERDLIKAEKLYRRAAKTSGGPVSTCVWDEYQKACNFITIDTPYTYGLSEASQRLSSLQAKRAVEEVAPEGAKISQ